MKTEFNVKLNGGIYKATIIHMPYCEWQIDKLEFFQASNGNVLVCSAILDHENQRAVATEQIKAQMLKEDEQEISK